MNENHTNKPQSEDVPNLNRDGGAAVKASAWKRLLSKKWVSPAAFMAAAAIIVTVLWLYQGTDRKEPAGGTSVTETGKNSKDAADTAKGGTLEVASTGEVLQWPVVNRGDVQVAVPFYEESATDEEKQHALIQAGTTFIPHTGLDLAKADNSAFEVVAALSGKVTMVDNHPTNGYQVEITHPNGIVTHYESLSGVQVNEGDEVKQGTIIAKAGRNELEKDLGVHLHFEVRENGLPINPADVLDNN